MGLFLIPALSFSQTTFKLKWDIQKLPFEVRMARGPVSLRNRLGETGNFNEKLNLPILKQMPDGEVKLSNSEVAYIYLFVKNKSNQKISFSVAPHSTHPGASALGFNFNCLCNGHIYVVEPNSIWYRIMELKTNSSPSEKNVVLSHSIFKIENK